MSTESKPWRDEERLRELYWGKRMSMREIAERFGCDYSTVYRWMDRNGIERRGDGGRDTRAKYENEDWLRTEYVEREKSTIQIAKEQGCGDEVIRQRLIEYGIERRDNAPNPEAKYRDEELMRRLYLDEGKSTQGIAEQLGYSKATIRRWLHRHGIPVRESNKEKPPCYYTNDDGYEVICTWVGDRTVSFRVHRLIAVAHGELDPLDIHNRDIDVHHKTGIPWDNRPDKIGAMPRDKHAELHTKDFKPDTD